MSARTIYITEADMRRLRPLVEEMKTSRDDLRMLQEELARAQVVAPGEVPADVITMNSKARIRDVVTGEETTYTLVFPELANIEAAKISVVAPIGTAMLGTSLNGKCQQVPCACGLRKCCISPRRPAIFICKGERVNARPRSRFLPTGRCSVSARAVWKLVCKYLCCRTGLGAPAPDSQFKR